MGKMLQLLEEMHMIKASDLHISVGYPPFARILGELGPMPNHPIITHNDMRSYLMEIATTQQVKEFDETCELDFAYDAKGMSRFRVNFYMDVNGMAAAFRAISSIPPTMEQLSLPPLLKQFAMLDKGLVLVTGPTGSGKSSALASMVEYANQNRKVHILTIEDPVEFAFRGANAIIHQREVSRTTKSFATALRAALREDPDIIMVGEMRDLETISLALEAAETGHLVFSTLHSQSAAKTVDRIIDAFPSDAQKQIRVSLSESIQAIISTMLVRNVDQTRRLPVLEILMATPAVRAIIREGQTFQLPNIMSTNRGMGMQTMDDHLIQLFQKAQITPETAMRFAEYKDQVGKAVGMMKLSKPKFN